MNRKSLRKLVLYRDQGDISFEELAIELFRFQYDNCSIYQKFVDDLGKSKSSISRIDQIPKLPITAFKNYDVVTGNLFDHSTIFKSSGTTGQVRSKHIVWDMDLYQQNAQQIFECHYGPLLDSCILALLPSYSERKDASLVYMMDHFIKGSNNIDSGFYLTNELALMKVLKSNQERGIRTILVGVSFALLDLAEKFPCDLKDIIMMETGGMKGRRKEMHRTELHAIIKDAFNLNQVHSEYGMTELLSQCYSTGHGVFKTNMNMHISIAQISDPLTEEKLGKGGVVEIIDLANIDSCCFIATEDIGIKLNENSFEIIGRLQASDLRGCNLMYQN